MVFGPLRVNAYVYDISKHIHVYVLHALYIVCVDVYVYICGERDVFMTVMSYKQIVRLRV